MKNKLTTKIADDTLLKDLQNLIDTTRQSVAVTVNSAMTLLYQQFLIKNF